MARAALLLPYEDMLNIASELADHYGFEVVMADIASTGTAVEKARAALTAGADLIIARGLQARLIRENTSVPIVEVLITGQELILLIRQAKNLVNKPGVRIALIGYKNMFRGMSVLEEIMDVRLSVYYLDDYAEIKDAVVNAVNKGDEVLIGGVTICRYAGEANVPSVFMASSREGLEETFRVARQVGYAIDLEKRNTAELKAILDYTVNSLIQIDPEGVIQNINHPAEILLNMASQDIEKHRLEELIPSLNMEILKPVLNEGREFYSLKINLNGVIFLAAASPVWTDNEITGAIITVTDSQQFQLYAREQQKELIRRGNRAVFTFDTLITRSSQMRELAERAKRCAGFNVPVLLLGESGTEKSELAQCIHNAGPWAEKPFIQFDCSSLSPEKGEEVLFGSDGLAEKADSVLFLNQIGSLSLSAQYKLYCLIAGTDGFALPGTISQPSLRILAAESRDLSALTAEGTFREDLYYALGAVVLQIPPLRQRKEDIAGWAELFLGKLQKFHGRYLHLTRGAWQRLRDYEWPGNLAQLYGLCQRLLAESPRRTIDELYLDSQLKAMSVPKRDLSDKAQEPVYCDPRAVRISQILQENNGNRMAAAKALGISTTTLWRYMKKYGIIQSSRRE